MTRIRNLWRSEPAAVVALVIALLGALAVPETWSKVVLAVLALAGGAVTRSQVYAPVSIDLLSTPPTE